MPKLIGKPIRIADFTISTYGTNWVEFLNKVPVDHLQQTDANYGTLQTAIARLENAGKIREREFSVRSKKKGKRIIVFVFHHAKTLQQRAQSEHKRKKGAIGQDIEKFILSQPKYEHSLPDVQKKIYEKVLSSRDDPKEYHQSYNATLAARKRIAAEKNIEFVEELRNDGVKVYRAKG